MGFIGKFEKVSESQYISDCKNADLTNRETFYKVLKSSSKKYDLYDDGIYGSNLIELIKQSYDELKTPSRATSGSAGYDFFAPRKYVIPYNIPFLIPTGFKCKMDKGFSLDVYPKSGLGFKTGIRLMNTVGIIDSDYYNNASNEGHIMIKVIIENIRDENNYFVINEGKGFAQGIFHKFYTVENDLDNDNLVNSVREGGFGSTDNSK
jgi:dUTP pyrophosphatase